MRLGPLSYNSAYDVLKAKGYEPVPGSSRFEDSSGHTGRIVEAPGRGDTWYVETEEDEAPGIGSPCVECGTPLVDYGAHGAACPQCAVREDTSFATNGSSPRFAEGFADGQRDREHGLTRQLCTTSTGARPPVVKRHDRDYYHGYKAAVEGAASEPSAYIAYRAKHRGTVGLAANAARRIRTSHADRPRLSREEQKAAFYEATWRSGNLPDDWSEQWDRDYDEEHKANRTSAPKEVITDPEQMKAVVASLRVKSGLEAAPPQSLGEHQGFRYDLRFWYDRDAKQFAVTLTRADRNQRRQSTMGLQPSDVETRGKSQWLTDSTWRLTPAGIEKVSASALAITQRAAGLATNPAHLTLDGTFSFGLGSEDDKHMKNASGVAYLIEENGDGGWDVTREQESETTGVRRDRISAEYGEPSRVAAIELAERDAEGRPRVNFYDVTYDERRGFPVRTRLESVADALGWTTDAEGQRMRTNSGYVDCACRDCFDTAISSDGPALCNECEEAGCDVHGESECQREDAYQGDYEENTISRERLQVPSETLIDMGDSIVAHSPGTMSLSDTVLSLGVPRRKRRVYAIRMGIDDRGIATGGLHWVPASNPLKAESEWLRLTGRHVQLASDEHEANASDNPYKRWEQASSMERYRALKRAYPGRDVSAWDRSEYDARAAEFIRPEAAVWEAGVSARMRGHEPNARKNVTAVIDAFLAGRPYREATCRTDGTTIWSYALPIATRVGGDVAVLDPAQSPSRTTTSQIRAVLASVPNAETVLDVESKMEPNARHGQFKTPAGLTPAEAFFFEQAGGSYRAGASAAERKRERIEQAKAMAAAEAEGESRGWTVEWEYDEDPDVSWMDDEALEDMREGRTEMLTAVLKDEEGNVLGSLGGVHLNARGGRDPYGRVVEAELIQEALHAEESSGRAMALNPIRSTPMGRESSKDRITASDLSQMRVGDEITVPAPGGGELLMVKRMRRDEYFLRRAAHGGLDDVMSWGSAAQVAADIERFLGASQ